MRRGDAVDVFTFLPGKIAEELEEMGATIVSDTAGEYDGILVNHCTCLAAVGQNPAPKVFTSHGPAHMLEKMHLGADRYVAVSDEIAQLNEARNPTVIMNPVDLDEFQPSEPNEVPSVLCLCKNMMGVEMTYRAAEAAGYTFNFLHRYERPGVAAEAMKGADIVVGVGRGVYEGLASGKKVVSFDARQEKPRGDGLVTEHNIIDLKRCNCSGRSYNRIMDVEDIRSTITCEQDTSWARPWAEENVAVVKQVDRYMELF